MQNKLMLAIIVSGSFVSSITIAADPTECDDTGTVNSCTGVKILKSYEPSNLAVRVVSATSRAQDAATGALDGLRNVVKNINSALSINIPESADDQDTTSSAKNKKSNAPLVNSQQVCAEDFEFHKKKVGDLIDEVDYCFSRPPEGTCSIKGKFAWLKQAIEERTTGSCGMSYQTAYRQLLDAINSVEEQYDKNLSDNYQKTSSKSSLDALGDSVGQKYEAANVKEMLGDLGDDNGGMGRSKTGLEGMPPGYDPNKPSTASLKADDIARFHEDFQQTKLQNAQSLQEAIRKSEEEFLEEQNAIRQERIARERQESSSSSSSGSSSPNGWGAAVGSALIKGYAAKKGVTVPATSYVPAKPGVASSSTNINAKAIVCEQWGIDSQECLQGCKNRNLRPDITGAYQRCADSCNVLTKARSSGCGF